MNVNMNSAFVDVLARISFWMKLHEREYEFACIVWDNEPLSSRALARLCEEKMGWKRTTTYTVLRKLCEKGVLKNDHALVTSLVKKEDVRRSESLQLLEKFFDGSLPGFVASFMKDRSLSEQEIEELRTLIDEAEDEIRS